MRTMYDSTNARDIPAGAEIVAGYVDGRFRWSDADWQLFPDAVKVRIACFPSTNDGEVLDVESGCSEPADAPAWVRMRRERGVDPSVYVNRSNVAATRAAFESAGVAQPHYWLASYDNIATIPEGFIAKQYANEPLTGGHFDASVVADYWPGVDSPRALVPARIGQSVDLILRVGEVATLQAIFQYPHEGRARTIARKVWAHRPGRYIYVVHPPVDPDDDVTEHLDESAIFVVDVTP